MPKPKKSKKVKTYTSKLDNLSLNWKKLILFAVGFAVVGTLLILATKAATPTASIQPETATITSPAIAGTDSNASGGSYVQFKATGAGGTAQTTNCLPSPHLCGFADETNTGIQPGVTLTKVPSQATSGSGWTYSGGAITITGNVGSATTGIEADDGVVAYITGSNLTVQNLKITGAHGTSTDAVQIVSTTNNVTIDHCDIQGAPPGAGKASPLRGWDAVHVKGGATNFSIKHCNVHGLTGGFFPEYTKGNSSFIGNYVHQLTCWNWIDNNSDCDAGAAKGGDHCNAWGDANGVEPGDTTSTMLLQDNTFLADNNGCVSGSVSFFNDNMSNGHQNAHSVTNHNLIGTTSSYLFSNDEYRSTLFSYMAITNNVFVSINGSQPAVWRYVSAWDYPIPPPGNANHNYDCGNYWDEATFRGTSADTQPSYNAANWFTGVASHFDPIVKCPATLPWTAPPGWVAH